MNELIINFAPTGMIPTKEKTPHVPVEPEEIITESLQARAYGVSMVHIHARDEQGKPTYKKNVYEKIFSGIRTVDRELILCVSTSGRNWSEFEKRSQCLELTGKNKPDMGSLTLSSVNFNKQTSVNTPEMIKMLAQKMMDTGIKPELEVFDSGMINYAKFNRQFDFIGYLDDVFDIAYVERRYGFRKLGTSEDIHRIRRRCGNFCIAVGSEGDLRARIALFGQFSQAGFQFPTLIHPSAIRFSQEQVGPGSIIEENAGIGPQTTIGPNCVLGAGAVATADIPANAFAR